MEKSKKNNINLIMKISLIIVFWPFVLIYYLSKKYSQKRKENLEKRILEEIRQAKVYKEYQDNLASPLWTSIFNNINK